MTTIGTTGTDLHWDVLTIKRPGLTRELPPGKEELMWVANSSTLIYGERDAILVDTFLTTEQSKTLLGWVVARGKNLTAIYITHGHGDHFFGLASLLERFPQAKAVARPPRLSRPWVSIYRLARLDRGLLASAFPRRDSRPPFGCRAARRKRSGVGGAQARRSKHGANRYGSLHMLARPIDRTDRWRRRRLQRHPSLSGRD
jgi:hypothetical protein